jgi:MFS family permease
MAFVGSFSIGLVYGGLFGLIAVFGAKSGLTVFQISLLVFTNTFFGAVAQYPIGKFSDRYDRRTVMLVLNLIAITSLVLAFLFGKLSFYLLLVFIGVHAAVSLPYYTIVISHMNDFLQKEEIVSGSSTITLVNAMGMVPSSIIASLFMQYMGSYGWFVYMIVIYSFMAPYNYYRIKVGRSSDIRDESTPSIVMPRTATPLGMQLATEQIINKIEEEQED